MPNSIIRQPQYTDLMALGLKYYDEYDGVSRGWRNKRAETAEAALAYLERAIDGFSRGENYYTRNHGLALMLARKTARDVLAAIRS